MRWLLVFVAVTLFVASVVHSADITFIEITEEELQARNTPNNDNNANTNRDVSTTAGYEIPASGFQTSYYSNLYGNNYLFGPSGSSFAGWVFTPLVSRNVDTLLFLCKAKVGGADNYTTTSLYIFPVTEGQTSIPQDSYIATKQLVLPTSTFVITIFTINMTSTFTTNLVANQSYMFAIAMDPAQFTKDYYLYFSAQDGTNWYNGTANATHFDIDTVAPGYALSTAVKLECMPGEYIPANLNIWENKPPFCSLCPQGTYSTDKQHKGACTSCTTGYSTASTGCTSSDSCTQCNTGYFWDTTTCSACAVGYYSDTVVPASGAATTCTSCGGTGYTTASTGSDSKSDCICADGYVTSGAVCVELVISSIQKLDDTDIVIYGSPFGTDATQVIITITNNQDNNVTYCDSVTAQNTNITCTIQSGLFAPTKTTTLTVELTIGNTQLSGELTITVVDSTSTSTAATGTTSTSSTNGITTLLNPILLSAIVTIVIMCMTVVL
jgi:hypothetical protein